MPDGGWRMGHDYSHYFARIFFGADYFWKNGFSVPHFTPYLCGGTALFADPQSIFYSVPQFLSFFLPVLVATRLSFAIFYFLGFLFTYRLLRIRFSTRASVAVWGASAFVLNGFAFAHLFVGHITHYPYLLAPGILLALYAREQGLKAWAAHVALVALILILTFYTGGLHVLVVFAGMILICLPSALAYRGEAKLRARLILLLITAAIVFCLGTAGQLVASALYSPSFHTGTVDRSGEGIFELLVRYLWFNAYSTPPGIPFGQWLFGAWEYVGFVTKWTIPGLFLALGWFLRQRRHWPVVILTGFSAFLIMVLASGQPLNEALPFFRHYHNPLKLLGAFILPLIVLTALMLEHLAEKLPLRFRSPYQVQLLWALGFVALGAEYLVYTEYFIRHPSAATYRYPKDLIEGIQVSRSLPAVENIITERRGDLESAVRGESSLACYEPLFGYRGESLHTQVQPGPALLLRENAWNVNHPGCLLYGKALGCQAWARIPAGEKELAERFLANRTVTEWVPTWHRLLIAFSFTIVGILVLGLGWYGHQGGE